MEAALQDVPFLISPYLRPYLEQGELYLDNMLLGVRQPLDMHQARIVTALWDGQDSRDKLSLFGEEEGYDVLAHVLDSLFAARILFPDRETCETTLTRWLEESCPELPFIDQIELTNHCPMKCQFCPRGIDGAMQRPMGFMDLDLFSRLLPQMHPRQKDYRPLELHHLGESLLHPEIHRFVEKASQVGLPTELSVNPSHLRLETAKAMVDAGLYRLVVSLDGVDNQTLAAIRGPAARYDRAERNLNQLLDYIAGLAEPPIVVIQMIDLYRNRHQRDAFLERWGNLGLPTVRAYIKDLDGDDPDLKEPTDTPLHYLCTYPWRSVVVLWDGRVVPCCRDADGDEVLGDLNQQTLAQIWHSDKVRQLRDNLHACSFSEGHLCQGCPWLRQRFVDLMPLRHPDLAKPDVLQW